MPYSRGYRLILRLMPSGEHRGDEERVKTFSAKEGRAELTLNEMTPVGNWIINNLASLEATKDDPTEEL